MEEIVALIVLVPLAILICLIVLFARGAGQRRQLAALRAEVDVLRREVRSLRADATSFSTSGRNDVLDQEMPPPGDAEPQSDDADEGNPLPDPTARVLPQALPVTAEKLEFSFADAGDAGAGHVSPPPESPSGPALEEEAPAAQSEPPTRTATPCGPRRPPQAGPPALAGALAVVWGWLRANPMLYAGLCVFLTGIAFALGYLVRHGYVSLEVRLALVGLAGLGMQALGWRLRRRNALYGLGLMGGGAVVLYFVLFTAARLELLSPLAALGMMVALVLGVAVLALAADAEVLAALSAVGGFLAPVLLSTGSADYLGLFGYYAALCLGNAFLLRFRAWDIPTLISFAAVYGIGGLWGGRSYEARMFFPVELFLLFFFVLFSFMQLQLAAHADAMDARTAGRAGAARRYLHASLLFGLPLLTFSYQYYLVRPYPYMAAFSALGMAAWHIGLGWRLRRRDGAARRLTREALLVLGLGFSALAVPLALNLSWTTCTWALQGLGLIWLGLRQKRPLLRFLGYALQLLAATTFMDLFSLRELISLPGGLLDNRMACGLVMTLAALLLVHFCSRHRNVLGRQEREMLLPWQIWAMIWWLSTGLNILSGFLDVQEQLFANAALVFTVLSCVLWVRIGTRLNWRAFAAAGHLLLPALLLSQWRFLPDLGLLPFLPLRPPPAVSPLAWSHGGLAALPLAWASFVFCLRTMPWPSSGDRYRKIVANAVLLSVPGLLLPAASNGLGRLPLLGPAWSLLLLTILAAAFLFLLRRGSRLPILSGPADPVRWSGLVLSLVLACWFCLFCALPGAAAPLPYIPLLGPLDMAQSLCLLTCLYWLRGMRHTGFPPERLYRGLLAGFGAGAFALCTVVAARAVSWYAYCPYTAAALVRSPVLQAVLSVLWGSIALGLVLTASRVFRQRKLWFAGAALLGLTLCKLLLFDLADRQTVYRIISFLFLGLLMLGMGYFCPLPPKRREEASEQNSSPAP